VRQTTSKTRHTHWIKNSDQQSCVLLRQAMLHRIFRNEQNVVISDQIRRANLQLEYLFEDKDSRMIAVEHYMMINKDKTSGNIRDFNISDGFISKFEKRNHCSSLIPISNGGHC
jgi:hypothetical protein